MGFCSLFSSSHWERKWGEQEIFITYKCDDLSYTLHWLLLVYLTCFSSEWTAILIKITWVVVVLLFRVSDFVSSQHLIRYQNNVVLLLFSDVNFLTYALVSLLMRRIEELILLELYPNPDALSMWLTVENQGCWHVQGERVVRWLP